MRVVVRPVERIDEPGVVGITALPAFLPQECVSGERGVEDADDRFLGCAVRLGDGIVRSLVLDPREPAEESPLDLAGGGGRLQRGDDVG